MVSCRERYKTSKNFLALFNPDMQYDYCANLQRCYMGKAPTLTVVNEAFGKNITETWLAIQIQNLSEFSGVRDKIDTTQIDMLAKVIIATFPYLKVTELMHFFLLFKSGKFGKFYGVVDGLVITEALQDFCRERNDMIYQFEQEEHKRKEEIEQERRDKTVARFRAFLAEYEITPHEWVKNQDLFKGDLTPEQIKTKLKSRQNKQQ